MSTPAHKFITTGLKKAVIEREEATRLLEKGVFAEAVAKYERYLKKRIYDAGAWNNLAYCYQSLGQNEKALSCYRRALRIAPQDPQILNNLGLCYQRLGLWKEAEKYFLKALKYSPEDADLLNNIGVCLVYNGKPAEACHYYLKALNLTPDAADILGNLAAALIQQKRFLEAIICYERALKSYSKDVTLFYNIAGFLEMLDKPGISLKFYHKALEQEPGALPALKGLAACLVRLKAYRQAIEVTKKIVDLDPQERQAWQIQGLAWEGLGENEAAARCYNKALGLT
ncbi:MAG: hypothetical protein PWP65_1011 [Clostridia bacterium]|nr:hypothetical protein [Clostridia bacterium]